MTGNFPEGFAGFQARLEAAAEAAGGDALAWMAAEHAFASAIEQAMRDRPETRSQVYYRRPHRGEWLRAREEDWGKAGDIAERRFYFEEADAPQLDAGERFRTIWGRDSAIRATRKAGILLAHRHGRTITISEPGYALARQNGFIFRSNYRHYGSEEGAASALAKLAQLELRA